MTDGKQLPIIDDEQHLIEALDERRDHIQRGNAIFDAFCQCNLYKVTLIKANYKNLNDWLARNAQSDQSDQNAELIILNEFELNQMKKYFNEWIQQADHAAIEEDHFFKK